MSIYKIILKCTDCRHSWIVDNIDIKVKEEDEEIEKCPECNSIALKYSIFNDSIANIDDERSDRYDGA